MGCASLCNWKSIFGFSAYLVVHIFAAGMIGLAIGQDQILFLENKKIIYVTSNFDQRIRKNVR